MTSPSLHNPIILAIDTSCDDTSVAVVRGRSILSNVVSSQVELHKKWGGVVPDIARRGHQDNIQQAYQEALKRAHLNPQDITHIAVTLGPGLAIALEVGIDFAKNLCRELLIPLIPIDHMEGHLFANFSLNRNNRGDIADNEQEAFFPALAFLISGKHTEIVYVEGFGKYSILGETIDDAAGEAFDKIARMLNLGYPGGPVITLLAKRADDSWSDRRAGYARKQGKKPYGSISGKFGLPVPMLQSGDLNFSFSGLKTACLYTIRELREEYPKDSLWANEFARECINAISRSLQVKLDRALRDHPECKAVFLGGGVVQNEIIVRELRGLVRRHHKKCFLPHKALRNDNAAMIGVAASFHVIQSAGVVSSPQEIAALQRKPILRLGDPVLSTP